MSRKIKSTLNFVKLWPQQNRREEVPFVIISNSQEEADVEVSKIVEAWTCLDKEESGNVVHQCYLKDVVSREIYEASVFDKSTSHLAFSDSDILQFIIKNKVSLVPTILEWVDSSTGNKVDFVTHDVYIGKSRYQGMTIEDCIYTHLSEIKF